MRTFLNRFPLLPLAALSVSYLVIASYQIPRPSPVVLFAFDGSNKKAAVGLENPLVYLSSLTTKNQGRELLPRCQTGQAPQDAHWRQGRARPGWEDHRGGSISEGGG